MANKKNEQSSFTVTDRRLFTADGELRKDAPEESEAPKASAQTSAQQTTTADKPVPSASNEGDASDREMPVPPTAAEQEAQAAAYRQSSKDLDSEVELSGHSAKDFEMTFERFMASLYMTAMMQLGLMREQGGQPRIDVIGARQTIDTLSLIGEKTKGNLTAREEGFLQNSLYELRMAYVEVTNELARPPQPDSRQPGSPQRGPLTGTGGR